MNTDELDKLSVILNNLLEARKEVPHNYHLDYAVMRLIDYMYAK